MQTIESKDIVEARRQLSICNACRYCEGYCSVFPALQREREFSAIDIKQLANLCHNCRGCHYSCQYSDPHEFSLNVPKVLAKVRQNSWEEYAFPTIVGRTFHQNGLAIAVMVFMTFSLMFGFVNLFEGSTQGSVVEGNFYSYLSHNAMVAIFIPAFIFPLLSLMISVRRFWKDSGVGKLKIVLIVSGIKSAAKMKNLAGGHGDGCNFEADDRFTHLRRFMHQLVMYGFILCFAATSVATIMHYFLAMPAPYELFSVPKVLGLSGGIALSVGTVGMFILKLKSENQLADVSVFGGEIGFIFLLFTVSTSGLLLVIAANTGYLSVVLSFHLGAVFAFFVLMPFSKMAHGFYRLTALIIDEHKK